MFPALALSFILQRSSYARVIVSDEQVTFDVIMSPRLRRSTTAVCTSNFMILWVALTGNPWRPICSSDDKPPSA